MGLEVLREQTPGPRGYSNSHSVSLSRAFLTDEDGIGRSTTRVLSNLNLLRQCYQIHFQLRDGMLGKRLYIGDVRCNKH